MEITLKERILLIENNYSPFKGNKEQLLKRKKVRIEYYIAWILGIFIIFEWCFICYWALIDILGMKPNAWGARVGMTVGNLASLILLFFVLSRNAIVFNHFLRIRDLSNDNIEIKREVETLNKSFLRLLKSKTMILDAIICVLIFFLSFFIFIAGQDEKQVTILFWQEAKYFLPFIIGILIFRQFYYLREIAKNVNQYEKLFLKNMNENRV